ncbi:hypothetical protein [Acerihabitans sp.]|uniref:hypothetical protein n=1 Tax=Acerihabitans sp. TaxID=2811394 RepID=UPI002EDA01FE
MQLQRIQGQGRRLGWIRLNATRLDVLHACPARVPIETVGDATQLRPAAAELDDRPDAARPGFLLRRSYVAASHEAVTPKGGLKKSEALVTYEILAPGHFTKGLMQALFYARDWRPEPGNGYKATALTYCALFLPIPLCHMRMDSSVWAYS